MGSKTKIEWVINPDGTQGETWNPVSGCSKVSDGCQNCYAESMTRRFDKSWKPWTKANAERNVQLFPGRLDIPLHWRKPRKVFVCSTSDLFHEEVPWYYIDQVFARMGAARNHTFLVLTKRPRKMRGYFIDPGVRERTRKIAQLMGVKVQTDPFWISADLWKWPLPNVWLGVTAENQATADERIPLLLKTPAAKRFVSIEPMLGPLVLDAPGRPWLTTEVDHEEDTKIEWVIVGGESGPKARPMHPDWARSIRDQCLATDTPFFFKGWGRYVRTGQLPDDIWRRLEADGKIGHPTDVVGLGKKAAGRELDGRIWEEMPK